MKYLDALQSYHLQGYLFLCGGICISYHQLKVLSYTTVGVVDNEVENFLLSRFAASDSPLCPKHAVHVFAENSPVVDYNDLMLNRIEGPIVIINTTDEIPQEIHLSDKQIDTIRARKIGDTGYLAGALRIKIGALVTLRSNINIEDKWLTD